MRPGRAHPIQPRIEPMTDDSVARRGSRPRSRQRTSVVQVFAELLLTAGVLIGLFVVWQVWINNEISGATQFQASEELSNEWAHAGSNPTTAPSDKGDPVVGSKPKADEAFANLIVPRFGKDFRRPIAEGVGLSVLNNVNLGMGHYPQSQMPGELGNFALASHRSAYGGAFHTIHQLRVGDPIYVETKDGWYKYIYRNTEYVTVQGIGVIAPVPQELGEKATERLITLTTCNPFYSSAERIIAYGVYDSWYPRADGPPKEIAKIADEVGN